MATKRTNIEIHEVSLCKKGANQGAKVVLAKSTESEMTEVEKLEKQVADLTAENATLKAEVEKSKPAEDEAKPDLSKVAPELRALIEKAQADADLAKADAKKNAEELAKVQKEALEKSVEARLVVMKTTFGGEEDRKSMLKTVTEMTPEQRESVMKALEKAEALAAKGFEKISTEVGDSTVSGVLSAAQEIEKKAKEVMEKDKCSIQKARVIVRDTNPELAKREQAESKERK